MATKINSRQIANAAALAGIGSAANTTLDAIFADINTIFAAATDLATPSTLVKRSTNGNSAFNNVAVATTSIATTGGTTTLTVGSAGFIQFTGTTTEICALPDATTLRDGHKFNITNRSTGAVTINDASGGLVVTLAANAQTILTLTVNGTAAGSWDSQLSSSVAGTVTSVATGTGLTGGPITSTGTISLASAAALSLKGNGNTSSGVPTDLPLSSIRNFYVAPTFETVQPGSPLTYATTYVFITASANATSGAVYQDSVLNNYTVKTTISGATVLYTSGPTSATIPSFGTLTKTSGTGDATITYYGYTKPVYVRIRMIGGGSGGNKGDLGYGGAGTASSIGSLFVAGGGTVNGVQYAYGNAGGTNSVTATAGFSVVVNVAGGSGGGAWAADINQDPPNGGQGGNGYFGGGGGGGPGINGVASTAGNGASNTGGGGGGAGTHGDGTGGGGGGAGGYLEIVVSGVGLTTLAGKVCTAGGGGSGLGSSGNDGTSGSGGSGVIIFEEYYQ